MCRHNDDIVRQCYRMIQLLSTAIEAAIIRYMARQQAIA
jgi:hypothetical protein